MDPTARWRALLAGPEADLRLDEAALLIAAHARPALDLTAELRRLDGLAARVGGPADTDAVIDLLFHRLGIAGNTADYEDPHNSYLDRVIDRGLGIPISLAVLLIEVGRRRGLDLEGVGMPGHFLVRDRNRPEALIDPFGRGRRLDDEDCRGLLRRVAGPDASLHPAMLASTGGHGILARMLANLDRSFRRRQEATGLAWVARLRAAIPDQPVAVLVEVAGTLGEVGCYDEAAAVVEGALAHPDVPDAAAVKLRSQATAWRARLN
jgi:regulator of sirC expression with transglutaminase-like and TPR domain